MIKIYVSHTWHFVNSNSQFKKPANLLLSKPTTKTKYLDPCWLHIICHSNIITHIGCIPPTTLSWTTTTTVPQLAKSINNAPCSLIDDDDNRNCIDTKYIILHIIILPISIKCHCELRGLKQQYNSSYILKEVVTFLIESLISLKSHNTLANTLLHVTDTNRFLRTVCVYICVYIHTYLHA